MAIEFGFRWLVPGRVIHTMISGEQSADEYKRALDIILAEIEEKALPPYTHCLYETSNVKILYSAMEALKIGAPLINHPKLGWMLQVNSNQSIVHTLVSSMTVQLARLRARSFKTLPEALYFLNDIDESLPDLSTITLQEPVMHDLAFWPVEIQKS